MFNLPHIYRAAILVAVTASPPTYAQQPVIYPARGQSLEQQQRDQGECMAWAQQTTGVNPTGVAQGLANQPPPPQRGPFEDERVKGALVGALGGAAIGAIAGNKAGKGAAIGAVVGTVAGGARPQQREEPTQDQTYDEQ